ARFQDFIFPLPDHVQSKKESEETLRKTDIAQPSIGAVSMAMDKILKRFNIAPQMTCGHSFGELSALYSAGWLDDTSFISLAVSRGRYMARAGNRDDDPGSMLAVQAPLEEIDAHIKNEKLDLVLANRNSPNQGVLSGATLEILKAGKICRKQKIRAVQLPVAAAFHSKRVENAVHPFINDLKSKTIAATSVDVLSNTSGECYPKKTDQIKQLLGNQLANPVRFVDNIEAMIKKGITTFIEVGPKTVLTGLAKSILSQTDCTLIAMDASCGKKSGPEDLALVLCRLAAKGFPVDLSQWEDKADLPEQKKMRIPLTGANPKPKNRCTRPKSSPQPVSPVTDQISDKTVKAGEHPPSHSARVRPTQDQPALTDIKTTDSQTQNRLTGRKGSDMTSQHHPPVNNHPPAAPHVYEAMKMVQKGLEAMQQLQIQTARTHEKFLETQAQASSTLANMLAHTQALAYPGTNEHGLPQHFPTADHPPSPVTPEPPSAPKAATPPVHGNQASEQDFSAAPPEPHASSEENKAHAHDSIAGANTNREEAPGRTEAAATGSGKTEEILFDIVSTLTGFPVEMLEPDMDIESDLGIDSIKKVEIISELEKQLPACDGLTTETIGTVRTLNDICRTIDDQAVLSMPESVSEAGASSKTTQPAPPADGEGINKTPSATVANILFNTISELTGFPVEMLEPDMNLESDLGIDSIKRVEILSKLEQELDHIHSVSSDEIAGLKTIKEIVNHLEPAPQDTGPEAKKKNPESEPDLNISLPGSQSREKKTAGDEKTGSKQSVRPLIRQKVRLEVFPTNQIRFYNGARIDLPPGKKVYITRDSAGIAEAFQHEFLRSNINAGLISLGGDTIPDLPDAAGIVLIPDGWNDRPGLDNALDFLKSSLMLVKQNAGYLMESAGQKGAFLTGISFLGGGFGFSNTAIGCNPVYGGIAGLIKTAAIEFRDVLCRVLDLPGSKEECLKNIEAATALMMTQGAVEMGLDGDSCNIPTLVDQEAETGEIDLGRDDVIVITGGAKGVTAACAIELAQRFSPTLILIGRSDISAEPEWAEGIDDPGSLKKAILSHEFEGRRPKPTDIERVYQTILSGREIRQNIKSMEDRGSIVRYIRADIRDRDEVKTVFKMIEKEFKPVTAVIHGAGVKNDKFIVDKDPVACSRVLGTKIEGLNALLSAARNNSLKYLILFSSIAARTGNQGQSDYAMANEALNKWAQQLAFDHPRMTTLSVNWGPWEGGMVDASLQKEFVRRGIDLIPLKTGARQLMIEMRDTRQTDPEVVIGGLLSPASKIKPRKLSKAMSLVCGPISFPILNAHKIDNEPVVPFALLMEYHAHAAVKNNPGLIFTGMDHMRLLKGVVTRNDEIELAIHLGKCQSDKTGYTASGSISSENENGRQFIHSTCSILLNDRLPKPPVLSEAAFMSLKPYPVDVEKAYDTYLFHGRPMQSIIAINGYSETGIEVVTKRSPSPDQWIDSGSISKWTIEPMMLDAAFQAAILWSVEELGQACLPSFLANLRFYSSFPDSTGNVRILFTVNEKTKNRIKGYFTFLNEADVVVASITGFEAVTDPSLGEKFKNAPLFSRESILAFAQGNPSDAFGEPYKIFDRDREIARLPRPPYFFMDRVVSADHPQWEMAPGGWIEAQYDLPENEWYFSANRSDTLPFCILLEIALQPCGWLAAYSGSALQSPDRLHFRNLGGRAHFIKPINRKSGTLTIRTRMTDLSKAGGMIIQDFDMEVIANGERVYAGTTNFGFFTDQALSNQVGIRSSEFSGYRLPDHMPFTTHTFKADAPLTPFDKNTSRDSGMPAKTLLMFDQIDLLSFDAGLYNNGYVKAVKTVDPDEWFFHAHFYQDPVCPGSLGVESFLQMLRFFMIEKYQINPTDYSAGMPMDHTHEWIYRGQIIPENKQVEIHAHIRQCNQSENSFAVTADGALVVDGICIYEMKNFAAGFDRINAVVSGIDPNQLSEKNK
ncbi:MAG: SDR family NAD(P)-dependent oxidoreductase, partial [Desulfobacterales bacterium]|nr:SDR family NAD(P)-dependent oxidoreductase [Desulfobacterales bacterium]